MVRRGQARDNDRKSRALPRQKKRLVSEMPTLDLLKLVSLGDVDDFLGNASAQRQPHSDIRWEMNSGPDAGLTRFIRKCVQRLGITRKQICQGTGRGAREAAMGRRIARVIWCREDGLQCWIQLEWSDCPIGVFRIPTGDARVVPGNAFERIGARRARRVRVETIFEDLLVRLFVPEPVIAGSARGVFPE